MQKEEWINEVFESTKGLEKATASTFLFEKIANRIEREKQTYVKPGLKWAFAVSVVILITVNLFSVLKVSSGRETSKAKTSAGSEYDHSTIYNY